MMICAETAQIIRDLSLPVLAVAGLGLACWRSLIAERQFNLFQQNSLRDRFKVGMELLGHERHSVRRGAVAMLSELARSHPSEFYMDVLASFMAFLTFPPRYAPGQPRQGEVDLTSDDTVGIVEFINGRTEEQKALEQVAGYNLRRRFMETPFRLSEDDEVQIR